MKYYVQLWRNGDKSKPPVIAQAAKPEDAAEIALALAPLYSEFTLFVYIAADKYGRDETLGLVSAENLRLYSANGYVDRFRNDVESRAKKEIANRKKSKRQSAFRNRFRPDIHADYEGWKRANEAMDDKAFWDAVLKEDYDAARARAVELGLTEREPEGKR